MAARTVRVGATVATVVVPGDHRRGLEPVLQSWAAILDAVFIATIAILLNISGSEVLLNRDLETNDELQAAGTLNVVSGALGGVPAYHALSLTALADRMKVDARAAGLIAAAILLAAILFGASVVGLIPRAIVGGVLVFLGLSFIVEWTWDKRHVLPRLEYWVVWVILIGVTCGGSGSASCSVWCSRSSCSRSAMAGSSSCARCALGDLPLERRPACRGAGRAPDEGDAVQILRISGFMFFGSANHLLEVVRRSAEETPPLSSCSISGA